MQNHSCMGRRVDQQVSQQPLAFSICKKKKKEIVRKANEANWNSLSSIKINMFMAYFKLALSDNTFTHATAATA